MSAVRDRRGDLTPEGVIKLSLGKKKHILVRPAWQDRLRQCIDPRSTIAGPLADRAGIQSAAQNSKIDRKMPGAITDSGLTCSLGALASPESL